MRNIARYLNAYLTQTTASSTLASLKDLYKEMPNATCHMPHVTNGTDVCAHSLGEPPSDRVDHWPRWERLRLGLASTTKKSSQKRNPKHSKHDKLPLEKMTGTLQKQIDLDNEQLRFSTAWFQD